MKNKKPYIVYQKQDQQQKNIKLNIFNQSRVKQEINQKKEYDIKERFRLNKEIKKIYFYNVEFVGNFENSFLLQEDQTIIFKNCFFDNYKLNLSGGNFFLIDPLFKKSIVSINAEEVNNLYFKLSAQPIKNEIHCDFDYGNNLELFANKNLKSLNIGDYQNVRLSNLQDLNTLDLDAKKVEFSTNNCIIIPDFVRVVTSQFILHKNFILKAKEIWLPDTTLIVGEQFQLIANKIQIGGNRYLGNLSEKATVTEKTFSSSNQLEQQRKLCSVLKGIRNYLENQAEKELNDYQKIQKQRLLQRKKIDQYFH